MVVLIPVVQLILGDPYTPTGGAISLSIAAVPFFARIAESAFSEVDPGLLEAAISTGATTRQIIVDAVFPQALPSFIRGVVLTIISLIGYSAMVGTTALAASAIWPFNTAITVTKPACSS